MPVKVNLHQITSFLLHDDIQYDARKMTKYCQGLLIDEALVRGRSLFI